MQTSSVSYLPSFAPLTLSSRDTRLILDLDPRLISPHNPHLRRPQLHFRTTASDEEVDELLKGVQIGP